MGYWIELHCDVQSASGNPYTDPICRAHNGEQPGVMVSNADIGRAPALVNEMARRQGFKILRGRGWICPACQKVEKKPRRDEPAGQVGRLE